MNYERKESIVGGVAKTLAIAGLVALAFKGCRALNDHQDNKLNELHRLEHLADDEIKSGNAPFYHGSLEELNARDSTNQYSEGKELFIEIYTNLGMKPSLGLAYESLRKQGYDGLVHFNMSCNRGTNTIQGIPIRLKKGDKK